MNTNVLQDLHFHKMLAISAHLVISRRKGETVISCPKKRPSLTWNIKINILEMGQALLIEILLLCKLCINVFIITDLCSIYVKQRRFRDSFTEGFGIFCLSPDSALLSPFLLSQNRCLIINAKTGHTSFYRKVLGRSEAGPSHLHSSHLLWGTNVYHAFSPSSSYLTDVS